MLHPTELSFHIQRVRSPILLGCRTKLVLKRQQVHCHRLQGDGNEISFGDILTHNILSQFGVPAVPRTDGRAENKMQTLH